MNIFKKYKVLIIVVAVLAFGVSIFFIANKSKRDTSEYMVKDLPLRIESTPISLNIVNENNSNILEATYTNDSEEIISRLVLEVKLKDTELNILLSYQSQHVRTSKAGTSCYSARHLKHFWA